MRSLLSTLLLGLLLTGCDFPMGGCEYSDDWATQLRIAHTDDLIPRLIHSEFPSSQRAEDIQPQFFPDGERILYRDPFGFEIRDAQSGRHMGKLPLGGLDPAFSPRGTHIALVQSHSYPDNSGPDGASGAFRSNLAVLHLDTEDTLWVRQDSIQLTDSTWIETRHFDPQWLSADAIAHRTEVRTSERATDGGRGEDLSFHRQLRLTTLDGTSRVLVEDSVEAFSAAAGSSHIAYSTAPFTHNVKLLDVSTGQSTRIAPGRWPVRSPNANQIAYLSRIDAERFTLWLYDGTLHTRTRLADSISVPFSLRDRPGNMAFSPDGSHLALLDNGRPKTIHLIETAAPHRQRTFYIDCGSPNPDFSCEEVIDPQFSPEGSRILFLLAGRETYDCAE